jgi:glycerate-2-kinase
MKQKALQIFLAGVDNVLPNKLVNKVFSRKDFQLDKFNNIYLLAFGKASFLMAKEAENILGERIVDGVVITTYGNGGKLDKLKVIEAGHPIPDNNGLKATKLVLNIADKAQENDLVLCLISGGSSALLADYPTDATINYLKKASELLINSGASISEINCVRKHLSSVKGGQLAKAIYPASTISLILSDVVGDKLDVIASGITAPEGGLKKPSKELKAFGKTRELNPGESETLTLTWKTMDMSSFNDKSSSWELAKGKYLWHIATSAADVKSTIEHKINSSKKIKVNDVMKPAQKIATIR